MVFPVSSLVNRRDRKVGHTALSSNLQNPCKDFCDHGRPRRYIFGLSIGLEFCVVLEDAQSKPASSRQLRQGLYKLRRSGSRE
jgi:hypothetical protein